ncbi:MAG: antitoxin Xre/MbcA/ParS toxin-binding domain-containing protein [Chloroflexota bacterium]
MARDRTEPTQTPRLSTVAASSALDLLRVARAMGLDSGPLPPRLDLRLVRQIAAAAGKVGIGRDAAITLCADPLQMSRVPALIGQLTDSLRASPLPRRELERLTETLDLDAIGRIVGASPVSLRRYLSGSRETPDDIAARIHWLALTVSDLLGAYNEIGVRRWFERPRTALEGRSPAQVLTTAWDPDDQGATAVRDLASALTNPGMGA